MEGEHFLAENGNRAYARTTDRVEVNKDFIS